MKDRVIQLLGLRRDQILHDAKIPKTKFYELEDFNAAKKKMFTGDIEEITLLAILNEETINIAPYKDDQVNYSEVYFIYIGLKSQKNILTIYEAIQKNIPNPCFIISGFDNMIQLQTSVKRLSKTEQGRQVIEQEYVSEWVSLVTPDSAESKYLSKLDIANFSFENLYVFSTELARLIYQSVFITILNEFDYFRKLETAKLKSYVDTYFDNAFEVARLRAEELKTPDFGERVSIHAKLIESQQAVESAKQSLQIFLKSMAPAG